MRDENELNNYNTVQFGKYDAKALKAGETCPNMDKVYSNPLLFGDYVACHKLSIIFVIALIALVFFTGTKVIKKKDDEEKGGKDSDK